MAVIGGKGSGGAISMSDWYKNIRKGSQGELLAMFDLMNRGFEVFQAAMPATSTDLIIHFFGECWRVQVKTGRRENTDIEKNKQEIVAWVNLQSRSVTYDPCLPFKVKPTAKKTDTRFLSNLEKKQKSSLGPIEIDFYCWNEECPVSSFSIEVHNEFEARMFSCPSCGLLLECQGIFTFNEATERHLRHARISVNGQIRDKTLGPWHPVALSVLGDDSLPGVFT